MSSGKRASFQSVRNAATTFTVWCNHHGSVYITQEVNGVEGSQWVCLDLDDMPGLVAAIREIAPNVGRKKVQWDVRVTE